MSRTIKFRGKRKNGCGWVYGNLIIMNDGVWIIPQSYDCVAISGKVCHGLVEVIPSTVGQFTGLEDKNDVKGYHHSWVTGVHKENKNNTRTGEIVWDEKNFRWGIQQNGWTFPLDTLIACYDFEIHDNPKLLEVTE